MPRGTKIDPVLLQSALEGLELRLAATNAKIAEIKKLLRTADSAPAAAVTSVEKSRPKRRKMSATARKRIAEAQRKRWAEFRARTAKKGNAARG
jgi:hypothetical protein